MDKEVSKAEFKKAYKKYRDAGDGWTDSYWEQFFEKEEGKRYFLSLPKSRRHNRLFITSDAESHRMYFLTEEAEESIFDFPGKE